MRTAAHTFVYSNNCKAITTNEWYLAINEEVRRTVNVDNRFSHILWRLNVCIVFTVHSGDRISRIFLI